MLGKEREKDSEEAFTLCQLPLLRCHLVESLKSIRPTTHYYDYVRSLFIIAKKKRRSLEDSVAIHLARTRYVKIKDATLSSSSLIHLIVILRQL